MQISQPPTFEILDELRDRLSCLYQERLQHLILFGSQARGDATPDSDIDILVVLKDEVDSWMEIKRTGQIVAQLCLEHSILINSLFMSLDQYSSQDTVLLRNIGKDGIFLC
ncbi:MAG: nucleotidyltransferase domain-containing protein [Spirulina sp. SIO3F2]|nr:nucleotidyltransferase domain-containing protein [Spirulina sp. SIO3F2]